MTTKITPVGPGGMSDKSESTKQPKGVYDVLRKRGFGEIRGGRNRPNSRKA